MSRTLSSSWTFFYKFLLPLVWIVGFAVIARTSVDGGSATMPGGAANGATPDAVWILILVGLVGTASILLLSVPLKRVQIDDEGELVISNYFREWRVPVGLVTEVTQSRWLKHRPITVRLRIDPGCGTRVVFVPPMRLRMLFWREDPEVEKLRELAGIRAPA